MRWLVCLSVYLQQDFFLMTESIFEGSESSNDIKNYYTVRDNYEVATYTPFGCSFVIKSHFIDLLLKYYLCSIIGRIYL